MEERENETSRGKSRREKVVGWRDLKGEEESGLGDAKEESRNRRF